MMPLTAREKEILEKVSNGYLIKQIGNEHTVKNHLVSVRKKLHAQTNSHAVRIGINGGIIK